MARQIRVLHVLTSGDATARGIAQTVLNLAGTVDRERFERTTGQVAEVFGVNVKPKMEDLYTDRFLPPAAERMLS